MPRLFRPVLVSLLVALRVSANDAPAPADPAAEAWRALRERRHVEAAPAFETALRRGPASAVLRLGHAVALLNRQPRRRENIAEADRLLAVLAREADDVDLQARYLRARVAEAHLFEPDPQLAARRYAELIADAPTHPFAQAAVPKLVRLRVYSLGEDPLDALAAAEPWASALTDASARRDYHFVMARSYLFFKASPERALAHLLAAREAGQLIPAQAAATLAGIAELARELGRADLARDAYREFLDTHRRDRRVYMIRQRLAGLGEAAPAPDR